MRPIRGSALACGVALALISGCGVRPQAGPVPMHGAPAARALLAGRWQGTYRVPGQGRSGKLRFELVPGADTAHGEVEISFARSLRLYGEDTTAELHRHPCTVIAIAVVLVEERKVRGTLAPYWDPDCDCRAVAAFDGEQQGDAIEGVFTTRREGTDSVLLRGVWAARRSGQAQDRHGVQ